MPFFLRRGEVPRGRKGVPVDSPDDDGSSNSRTHEITLSVCPFCSSGCGLFLHSRSSEVVGVSPVLRHPISAGRLCARGWGAHEGPLWGERLLFPTVGRGRDRRRVGWAEAFSEAGRQIRRVLGVGRPLGVLGSGRVTNEEAFLAVRLARDALGTPHVDFSLRSPHQAILSAYPGDGEYLDLRGILEFVGTSDTTVLIEHDLSRSHPQIAFLLMRAVGRGTRLITLGPAPTQMSSFARPRLFLDPTADPEDLPSLDDALGPGGFGSRVAVVVAPYTSDISRLFSTVREIGRRVEMWSGATGAEVRWLSVPVQANALGALQMGLAPGVLPGSRWLSDEEACRRLRSAWGDGVRLDQGVGADQMLWEVGGVILLRENPEETQNSSLASLQALEELECVIALDSFRSPATDLATVTLPLGAYTETRGSVVSPDGLIQHWRPVHGLPGEAREGWRILNDLLDEMGLEAAYGSLSDVRREIGAVIPELAQGSLREQEEPWRRRIPEIRVPPQETGHPAGAREPAAEPEATVTPGPGTVFRLAVVGSHDWGDDLAVRYSPNLCRDGVSRRKLFPAGRLVMNRGDADRMGVRDGWKVRLRSRTGESDVPVALNPEVEPGILLVPFGFREHFSGVLGGAVHGHVMLERL